MALRINFDLCTACGDCAPVCPEDAILEHRLVFEILPERCTECEGEADTAHCLSVCPIDDCILPVGVNS